jgi:uncharacterized protein (TIGR00297 family)
MVVFYYGGWRWFVILLIFLIISSLFTRFKYSQKREIGIAQDKKGARSWVNVVANGFASAGFAVGKTLLPVETVMLGFLGSVSAAFADTLSTEIGILSKSSPRLITNLRQKVPVGTSGGVSVLGELSVLISTAILTLSVWAIDLASFSLTKILFVTLVSGYAGTTTDSLLGATYQAKYGCEICGRTVESKRHCDKPTKHLTGRQILDNNGVNFIATWIGALTAILFQWVAF